MGIFHGILSRLVFLAEVWLTLPLSRHVINSIYPVFPYGVTRYKKSIYLLCQNMKNMINKQDLVLYMVAQLGTVRSQHQQTLIIPQHRVITGHITFSFFYHDALQCDRIIQKPCQFLLAPDEYLNHTIYPHYPSALICNDIIYLIKSYRLALFITYSDQTNCICYNRGGYTYPGMS